MYKDRNMIISMVQARTAKLFSHTFLENLTSPNRFEHTIEISEARHATLCQVY